MSFWSKSLFYFLIAVIFSTLLFADDGVVKTFYTDESDYYLKLHKDGFFQRFRVRQEVCNDVTGAQLEVQGRGIVAIFEKREPSEMSGFWPKIYGQDEGLFCWFEAKVSGLNLNDPQSNKYVIRINVYGNASPIFFGGYQKSVLPSSRFYRNNQELEWIDLGGFGATPVIGGGVFFKVWEPLSERVDLFLNSDDIAIQMVSDNRSRLNQKLSHVVYVSNARVGDQYYFKFVKNGKYERLEVANGGYFSEAKMDPFARKIVYGKKGGFYNGYIDAKAVVVTHEDKKFKSDNRIMALSQSEIDNWIIYQLWPAMFNPEQESGKYKVGTFNSVSKRLDYLEDLGVNAIELLPINVSRFNVSWGYALDSLIALEDTLGTDADLVNLVDNMHARGMRVLFDVVINHVNNSLLREPLSKTLHKTKYYAGDTEWGPMPDFSNVMVRRWLKDGLLEFARIYHIDGFRFDMTGRIHNGNSDGYMFLQELNTILKMDNQRFYTSAEELPDNVWVTKPVTEGGVGFDSQWNDIFKNVFEEEFNGYRTYNRWVNLYSLQMAMQGYSSHKSIGQHYHYGPPLRAVSYLGSHDFIGNKDPFVRIISDYVGMERDGHNEFYQVRPLEDPSDTEANFRLIHNDFTHDVTRLAYGVLFSKPGALLFYQGEELASDINIENEWRYVDAKNNDSEPTKNVDVNRYVSSNRMPWEYFRPSSYGPLGFLSEGERSLFTGHHRYFKELIKFRNDNPRLNEQDAFNVNVDYPKSLMTYQIRAGIKNYFVIANFGGEYKGKWINFPHSHGGQWWSEKINSSDKKFGGITGRYANIISNFGGRSNMVRIAPSSFILFEVVEKPAISKELFLMGSFNNWQAYDEYKLVEDADGKHVVDFYCSNPGLYELKVATEDWEVALGSGMMDNNGDPFNKTISGTLNYVIDSPNVKVYLEKGHYRFTFDVSSFKYTFVKVATFL